MFTLLTTITLPGTDLGIFDSYSGFVLGTLGVAEVYGVVVTRTLGHAALLIVILVALDHAVPIRYLTST